MDKNRSGKKLGKPKFVITFVSTFNSKNSAKSYIRAVNSTSTQAAQVFRANHGGGMPCPDSVSSKPSFLDNV